MKLNETQGDGLSTREHLASVEKITGRKPKELEDLIELPSEYIRRISLPSDKDTIPSPTFSILPGLDKEMLISNVFIVSLMVKVTTG